MGNILKFMSNSLNSSNLSGNIIYNKVITDDVKNLTNLTSLKLSDNKIIADDGIKYLTNLTSLNLHLGYLPNLPN